MTTAIRCGAALTVLALVAGSAFGQMQEQKKSSTPEQQKQQQEKTKQQQQEWQTRHQEVQQCWKDITQEMDNKGITLDEAIATATKDVSGTAVGARVVPARGAIKAANSQEKVPYRIEVLCRTNEGKFRVVRIDGENGKVLGTAQATAPHPMSRRAYAMRHRQGRSCADWQMGSAEVTVFNLMKATTLEKTRIEGDNDQNIGRIEDFAIRPDSGRIAYAAVSFGGVLGVGDKLFAVPMDALDVVTPDLVILDVTKKQLENAQGFNKDDWPRQANTRWEQDVRRNERQETQLAANEQRDPSGKTTGRSARIEKASELIGKTVKDRENDDIGKVSDLYIDPDRDRVCFAVVSHGGVLGVGNELIAVPWRCVQVNAKDGNVVVNLDKETMKRAPRAKADDPKVWGDPDWAARVYGFYGADPYWEGGDYDDYDNDDWGGDDYGDYRGDEDRGEWRGGDEGEFRGGEEGGEYRGGERGEYRGGERGGEERGGERR